MSAKPKIQFKNVDDPAVSTFYDYNGDDPLKI